MISASIYSFCLITLSAGQWTAIMIRKYDDLLNLIIYFMNEFCCVCDHSCSSPFDRSLVRSPVHRAQVIQLNVLYHMGYYMSRFLIYSHRTYELACAHCDKHSSHRFCGEIAWLAVVSRWIEAQFLMWRNVENAAMRIWCKAFSSYVLHLLVRK